MKSSPSSLLKILPFRTKAPAFLLPIQCHGRNFRKKGYSKNSRTTSKTPFFRDFKRMNITQSGSFITDRMGELSLTFLFPTPTSPAQNQSKSKHTTPVPTNPFFTMRAQSSASKTVLRALVIPKGQGPYRYQRRSRWITCPSLFLQEPSPSTYLPTEGKPTTKLWKRLKRRSPLGGYGTERMSNGSSKTKDIRSFGPNHLFQLKTKMGRNIVSSANISNPVIRLQAQSPNGIRKYAINIRRTCLSSSDVITDCWRNVANASSNATRATNTKNGNVLSFT